VFSFGHHDDSPTSRVTYTYQPMKAMLMATADNPRRSQKAGVSAGSRAREGFLRRDGPSRDGMESSNPVVVLGVGLIASSADGPVGAKPGSRPAQPLQNMAFSRLGAPQIGQATDMNKLPA